MQNPGGKQLARIRKVCLALPDVTEKRSHGEPTFFVGKRVFAMFANDHHGDGHIAVWIPAKSGLQEALIQEDPAVYFRPPFVGPSGWVGVELARVSDETLASHLREAWELIAARAKVRRRSQK